MAKQRLSLANVALNTIVELIIIFTAAAAGAVIGSGRSLQGFEWFLAITFVLMAVVLRTLAELC